MENNNEEMEVQYDVQVENELLDLIRGDLPAREKKERFEDYHDADIAQILEKLTQEERKKLYIYLGTERMSDVLSYLDADDIEPYLVELGVEKSADILEEMDADDAVDVLENLTDEFHDQLIEEMNQDAKDDIELISSYEDDEIGSMMTTNFVVIDRGISTKEAMKELISQSEENDNISTIYVVNPDDGTYYGALDLKDLIRARVDTNLNDVITTAYPYVLANAKIEDEIERLRGYNEDSIPVLDENDHILGVITPYDLVEAVDDAMGEDYAKFAGLTAEEDLKETLPQSIRKRMPWLIVLFFLGLLVSTVVGMFEGVVQQIAMIVSFQSLILDMAGNVGTQSLAVTIRVLMDETLTTGQKVGLLFKEARVGFVNGLILGLGSWVFVGLYVWSIKKYPVHYAFLISACVGIALLAAMVISSMVGTLVPMFFHKIKVDPAVASGPLITTVNDLVAVVSYYGLAWLLLIRVMHITG